MKMDDPVLRFASDDRTHAIGPLAACRIGRDPSSEIVLAGLGTSRTHAMIRRDMSGACILSDSGSRNGTLVNGLPITAPVVLQHGDQIRIGGETLHFEQPHAPVALVEEAVAAPATQVFLSSSLVTVLVADMRGFTQLAREVDAEQLSALLSELFGTMGKMLNDRRCFYQKYIGDAIMALWVHERPQVDHRTFAAVLDMLPAIQELVAPMQSRFDLSRPVSFGIGINSGMASIGNLGSATASDFTAVGDAVNKAFRLEAATRTSGADVLIGRNTIDLLFPAIAMPGEIQLLPIDLKGYDSPEQAYLLATPDLPLLAAALAEAGPQGMVA
jgi:adenylate cyclase